MRPSRLLPLLPLLVLALALPGAASAKVTVGIADNKADMFFDQRFADLGVQHVRVTVPYDTLNVTSERRWLDGWMAGAAALHQSPLVTFDRSRQHPKRNPTPAAMAKALKALRKRYPFVHEFATWNEANLNKQPRTVARWWRALRNACPSPRCTVLGADLLDSDNIESWSQRFVHEARLQPGVWGLHNYIDANRLTTTGTRALLKAVKGKVWFTETGGVISRHNHSKIKFPMSAAHAATATSFLFRTLSKISPRIQRMYLYNWNTGPGGTTTWDSAFIGPTGKPRPALATLQRLLGVKVG